MNKFNNNKTDGKDWDRNYIKEHGMNEFLIKRFRELDWKLYQICKKLEIDNKPTNTNKSSNQNLDWSE